MYLLSRRFNILNCWHTKWVLYLVAEYAIFSSSVLLMYVVWLAWSGIGNAKIWFVLGGNRKVKNSYKYQCCIRLVFWVGSENLISMWYVVSHLSLMFQPCNVQSIYIINTLWQFCSHLCNDVLFVLILVWKWINI